jgi:hypothetical protein
LKTRRRPRPKSREKVIHEKKKKRRRRVERQWTREKGKKKVPFIVAVSG